MELIVQPDDGLKPLLQGVDGARESIDIVIFRFDLKPLEKALEAAVKRGVTVRALVAHTNRGGEKRLRQLEQRMLDAGVTVTRTGGTGAAPGRGAARQPRAGAGRGRCAG